LWLGWSRLRGSSGSRGRTIPFCRRIRVRITNQFHRRNVNWSDAMPPAEPAARQEMQGRGAIHRCWSPKRDRPYCAARLSANRPATSFAILAPSRFNDEPPAEPEQFSEISFASPYCPSVDKIGFGTRGLNGRLTITKRGSGPCHSTRKIRMFYGAAP
jgi:hypothetical protein